MVLGEVTPSWSSFTRGSADRDFRLTAEPPSLCPELVLGLETELGLELEGSCSDGIFSLGLGTDDDDDDDSEEDEEDGGLGVREELGLPVDSLEMGLIADPRPDLEPPWCESEEGLVLGVEAEVGLAAEEPLGLGAADVGRGLEMGLLVVGLTPLPLLLLLSLSLRWLLYELRLGSLYRSTVRTFP